MDTVLQNSRSLVGKHNKYCDYQKNQERLPFIFPDDGYKDNQVEEKPYLRTGKEGHGVIPKAVVKAVEVKE